MRLLLGDLAFLYDLNSLPLLLTHPHHIQIIILNNNGGAVFERLAIAKHQQFEKFFKTPHHLDLQSLIPNGLRFKQVTTPEQLTQALNQGNQIIEVKLG